MSPWSHDTLLRNALGLLLAPFVLYALFRWFEFSQVYHPSRTLDATGDDLGRPWEDVVFRARDGTQLHGWFFPAEAGPASRLRVFLICHGNAGNISHRLLLCSTMLRLGVAVFVFDYRGYGRSAGRPGEEGIYSDAEAAHDWLQTKGFTPPEIVALGESLGGAVATELARRRALGGLILLSTFTSIPDLGAELFPWLPAKRLGRIRYDTHSKLPQVRVPVLIMHSRADTLIGYHHAQRLFAVAQAPKTLWEVFGDHNDTLVTSPAQCAEGVRQFLALLGPR